MARRPINRLFQTNEFRLYLPDNVEDRSQKSIPFYIKKHPNREMGNRVTVAKEKTALLRAAAAKVRLEFLSNRDENGAEGETLSSTNIHLTADDFNILHVIPKEIMLAILSKLDIKDLSYFVQTSRCARSLGYDNLLWKKLCHKVWHNPYFLHMNLDSCGGTLRLWYNWNSNCRLSTLEVLRLFQAHIWRLIYVSLQSLDLVPSIIDSPRNLFTRRTSECYPTSRSIKYLSSLGEFRLVGVNQTSRVEFTVNNYLMQPWHKKEYRFIRPIPIFDLKNYGLKVTRSIRGQNLAGFFRRRGYYLKTDMNRKVHLAYRYFPTIRFRLYSQGDHIFLLCQDIFMNGGDVVDCYTMYEVIHINQNNNNNTHIEVDNKVHVSSTLKKMSKMLCLSDSDSLDDENDAETGCHWNNFSNDNENEIEQNCDQGPAIELRNQI